MSIATASHIYELGLALRSIATAGRENGGIAAFEGGLRAHSVLFERASRLAGVGKVAGCSIA